MIIMNPPIHPYIPNFSPIKYQENNAAKKGSKLKKIAVWLGLTIFCAHTIIIIAIEVAIIPLINNALTRIGDQKSI